MFFIILSEFCSSGKMYKFWLSVCVIIILVQTQSISGDLSIDQRIREGNRKREQEVERNRMTTLELDMVVEENNKHKIFHRYNYNKNAAEDTSKRWNRGTIFYVFGAGIDSNAAHLIRDALEEWEYFSCLHFSKDVHNEQYNRIVFTSNQDDKGCASTYVGMKQGKQEIHLGKNCLYRDIILHEVGHALGFHHEHNRADRDRFIKVHDENIEQGYEDSFQKMKPNDYEDFDKPFDYKSIMHYGQYFFSKNESKRLITMETLNSTFQNVIGHAKHPSFLDYKILNIMYECSAGCYDVPCSDDGFLGKQCRCYCEGEDDNKPVVPCFQKDECQNPSINPYLFEVLDKRNWTEENINLTFYPDKTVFNLFSKNSKCSLASQLQCDNGIWIGKIHDCPVELEIQSFGCSQNEGIIEVILNGERGLICDDNWDDNDATVACRMMGFEFGKARFENNSKANESLPILLDEVKCSGHESMLSECEHSDWGKHDCDHSEVAAVTCFANRRTKHNDVLSNNDCGKIPLKGFKRRKREERVVGGIEASAGSYPWQVGIQRWVKERWIHWCGGTIISSHWILSAAHCYRDLTRKHDGRNRKVNYEDFRVHIGDHDLTKHENHEKRFQIEYLVKHWQFERDRTHPIHDVALLKINSSVVFNDYVQPACLPGENDQLNYGMKCEVSGWGKRNESGKFIN
ncbi:uncharacterized protein LOC123552388 isoform X2 [Mercenaria mercenaria]|uniref:uncharacterized protein LOC123552388 isoform X2 n=1 Tax=Mercenaria mercenaria TaxID=6596 RepID=UPI00234E4404|nr:uncharacterized protein LOC123552388 isoform X2 [Mercenaria mercenaria]